MTAPPPRPGSSAPDANKRTTAPPPAATPSEFRFDRPPAPGSAAASPHGPMGASEHRHDGPPMAGGPASTDTDPATHTTVPLAAPYRPPHHPSGPATASSAAPATAYGLFTDAADNAAEKTVTDVLEPEPRTALTMARHRDDPPLSAAESTTPPLMPDAILPPGTIPEAPADPEPEPEMDASRPTPRLGSGEPGPGGPGGPDGPRGPHRSRRGGAGASGAPGALLIGGGALAALLLGGGGVLAYTTMSDDAPKKHPVAAPPTRASQPPPTPSPATPTPARTSEKPKPKPKPTPVDIRDEKKDPKPLSVNEAFPANRIKVAGHTFVLMKTVPNDHCNLTANGPFSAELTHQHCRRVVRATFVSDDKKLAVTTGIAAMPTDAAAAAAMKAQDAEHYKWFRGMKATNAPKIDQGGGYAVSLQRGRYIIYSYAMYADAHKPKPDDTTLKDVANGFRDTTSKPIDARAKN
ncbi:hypothetical protein NE236_06300 [Actinoallomurus purpureus]|uniref:hypothetical protein n=1 Tax=Actinoallomurus purpureus TaxID=478114 RepID=UPI0020928EC0|nr:hypothetical protein [Actinoallomurus purpureus]MCO6004586.1 hypothetical protein [Actinoallomurus purpureus]